MDKILTFLLLTKRPLKPMQIYRINPKKSFISDIYNSNLRTAWFICQRKHLNFPLRPPAQYNNTR